MTDKPKQVQNDGSLHAHRREFTRASVTFEVEATSGRRTLRGTSRDVSLKGAFMQCEAPFEVDTECEFTLLLPGPDEPVRISVAGRVVRAEASGMAVEFTELGMESYEHLKALVLYNAADWEQVEEEFATHLGLRAR